MSPFHFLHTLPDRFCFEFSGNGRPFVLEVTGVLHFPSQARLDSIVEGVASCQGLNDQGDVEVSMLRRMLASLCLFVCLSVLVRILCVCVFVCVYLCVGDHAQAGESQCVGGHARGSGGKAQEISVCCVDRCSY